MSGRALCLGVLALILAARPALAADLLAESRATDAAIEARWRDDNEPVDLRIANGQPVGDAVDGLIHFTIPARHWWDDIVET